MPSFDNFNIFLTKSDLILLHQSVYYLRDIFLYFYTKKISLFLLILVLIIKNNIYDTLHKINYVLNSFVDSSKYCITLYSLLLYNKFFNFFKKSLFETVL